MAAPLHRREGSLDFTRTPSSTAVPVVIPPSSDDRQHRQQERLLKGPHNKEPSQVSTPESRALYAACSDGAGLVKVGGCASGVLSDPSPRHSKSIRSPNITIQVEGLLAKGANANWYNNEKGGETALHAASRRAGAEAARVVAALIAAGAQPGVISLPEFNTPLHLAAAAGNLETVKLLIEVCGGVGAVVRDFSEDVRPDLRTFQSINAVAREGG